MQYNFDQIIERKGTYSEKWDALPAGAPADALPLWVADMDFACAQPVLDALHRRIDRQILGYSLYDNPDCKSAVTGWFSRRFGWEIDPAQVFFSPGVVPAIALLVNMLTNEGDGVLIQPPVYYPFAKKISANHRRVVTNPLVCRDGRYEMDFDDLAAKLSDPAVKGMILCSPHNPTGRVWSEEELRRVAQLAREQGKWIISDEIHCDLTRAGVTHHPMLKVCAQDQERIIACTSPSKTFNLAGMQLSNIVIPNPAYQKKWDEYATDRFSLSEASPLGITAAIAAYQEGEEWLEQARAYIDGNMAFAKAFFAAQLPKARMYEPEGTYLIWVDLRAYCADHLLLEQTMQQKARVALDEGYIFGIEGAGFERINAACPRSVLEDCLKRMARALNG